MRPVRRYGMNANELEPERLMKVEEAVAAAKQHLAAQFGETPVRDLRLEEFLFDDHLGVWTLTFGFAPAEGARAYKIVRVAEADKAILSARDR